MIELAQLLIGAFFIATVAVSSWGAGLVMGLGLAKLTRRRDRPGNDVEELLRRERDRHQSARQASPGAVPSATGKPGVTS